MINQSSIIVSALVLLVASPSYPAELSPTQICQATAWGDAGIISCDEDKCRARDGSIQSIKVEAPSHNEVYITLRSGTDSESFEYICRVEGNRVIMSTLTNGVPEPRWINPDHPGNEKKYYYVKGNKIVISSQYSDGSSIEDEYLLSVLMKQEVMR